MSFFEDFVGGGAAAVADIADNRIKSNLGEEKAKSLADYQSQLEMQKLKTIDEMKRTQSAADGKAIQDGADLSDRQRIADGINQANGSSMTADDAVEIAKNPAAMKAYGLIGRSRAQDYDAKIAVAERLGLDGKTRELRDQQTIENNRTREDNRDATTNKRLDNEAAERKLDRESMERRHRESMGQGAGERKLRLESLQMDINEKNEAKNLLTRYETEKDPILKTALHESLVLRGVIKKSDSEYDKREITNETPNADGGTTTTKDTLRVPRGGQGGAKEDVIFKGKVIGQASSMDEAKAMIAKAKGANDNRKSEDKPPKQPPLTVGNTEILSPAGETSPMFGSGVKQYNVKLPDGTTKVMDANQLQKMGHPIESINGKLTYSPNYFK